MTDTMKITMGRTSDRRFMDTLYLPIPPRVGEIVDKNGLHRVDMVVWHARDGEATIYVTKLEGMPS